MSANKQRLPGIRTQARLVDEQRQRRAGRDAVRRRKEPLQLDGETLGVPTREEFDQLKADLQAALAALKSAGII